MYTKKDVEALVCEVDNLKTEPAVETETGQFGLSAQLFDPVSHQIITLAQPHRADVGQPEILLTPAQAAQAVATARTTHLHNVRAAGHASIEAYNEAQAKAAAVRDLARKQAAERAMLDEDHAAATAKAAAGASNYKEDASRRESVVD
jgi:hypothetical protein